MKNNSFIVISGIFIISIFSIISATNLLPDNVISNSYYTKNEKEMTATIQDMKMENNKLVITTTSNSDKICVKTTKTKPTEKSLCWKQIENNNYEIGVLSSKKYFIWLMDSNMHISDYIEIKNNK